MSTFTWVFVCVGAGMIGWEANGIFTKTGDIKSHLLEILGCLFFIGSLICMDFAKK